MTQYTSVCMIHAFDPRGDKIGGVETFVRDYINFLPADVQLLLVGVDQIGDLPLGKVTRLTFRGRQFDFMPVMRVPRTEDNFYATKLSESLTLKFLLAVFRHMFELRRYVKRNNSSLELRRMEHFPIALALRAPFVQMLHDGKTKDKAMSSLLKRFWWVNETAEKLSLRFSAKFFCVSDELTNRLKTTYPKYAEKLETLTTWANPQIFSTQPFNLSATTRVVYAGRLDAFKRPEVMFSVLARLANLSNRPVEFHYIGDGDAGAFSEFAQIQGLTILEGKRSAQDVAAIYTASDVGILTSDFEGMPRMVMELLTIGRPVVALDLPQLHNVIKDGISGTLVNRGPQQIDDMARSIMNISDQMHQGSISPSKVSSTVSAYHPQALLLKLFDVHRHLRSVRAAS